MTAPGRDVSPDPGATVTGLFAASELRVGELVAGRFRIEELIGVGGMGVVYRAEDEQLHVPVALKLLRPELAARPDAFQRFRQELLLARQVSSPHVVRIHDIVAHEGRWLISMDYVAGGSLERLLDADGALSIDDAVKVARQLALGLAAAHQRQVIHRDLKPANVLVTGTLDAYITDFGVARTAGVTGITGSGVVVGTPEYLSPEQARADPVDHRSDLYALGLMLYEMLAGRPAFEGGTPAEMLAQRIVRSPPPVTRVRPDVPRWLAEVVARLTQLKPARRFANAEAVVRAIDERRVPGIAPRPSTIAAIGLAIACAAGVAWLAPRFARDTASPEVATEAPAPVAEVRRIALYPSAHGEGDAALAAALDALVAETLLAQGVRTADAARVRRAQRQLGYDDATARRQRARVAALVGAQGVLEPTIARDGERIRLALERREPPGAEQASARYDSGALTADALQPAVAQGLAASAATERGARSGATLSWPQDLAAVVAYGEGRLALDARDDDTARAAFARATAIEPGFALAWQERLALALRLRDADAAPLATEASTALRGARGRDAERVRGFAALARGETEAAIGHLAPLVDDASEDRAAAFALARALAVAGRDADAIAALERHAELDPHDPEVWFMLGREAVRAGEAQRGVDDYLVRAQVAYTRLGDRRGQADVANALGVGYERLGQLEAARTHFERAADEREASGDARGAAASLRNLAWVEAVRGAFDEARAATKRARTLLEPLDDDAALGDLVNDEGLVAEQAGDFREALARYREALALRKPLGNAALTAESLGNVGYAYIQVGEFDNARVFLEQARDAHEARGDEPGIVRTMQSQALAATHEGRWDEARAALDDTLARAEAAQMVEERAVSLAYLVELDRLEGRFDDARVRLDAAGALFAQRDDARGLAEVALLRGAVELAAGRTDAAAAALASLESNPPPNREQHALLDLRRAELALARGDAALARDAARRAHAGAEAAHAVPVALEAKLAEAQALAAGGDAAAAGAALETVRAGLERFPSRALALGHARTALALVPDSGLDAQLAATRALLERTPRYGGAAAIHEVAAARLAAAGRNEEALREREAARALRADQTHAPDER